MKWTFSLMRYAIVGVIVLTMGSEILRSVASIAFAYRFGNALPLITVVTFAGILMIMSGRAEKDTPLRVILDVCAWTAVVYAATAIILVTLHMGVLVSLGAVAITVSIYSTVQSPTRVRNGSIFLAGLSAQIDRQLVKFRAGENNLGFNYPPEFTSFIIPLEHADDIMSLLQTDTTLSVSVSRYEEFLGLIVPETEALLVRRALATAGIDCKDKVRGSLTATMLLLPHLEEEYSSVLMSHYGVIYNQDAIKRLVADWPIRAILFPSRQGLRLILRAEDAAGFRVEKLPWGLERRILVERDFSSLTRMSPEGA